VLKFSYAKTPLYNISVHDAAAVNKTIQIEMAIAINK
jgi:hypothetical protein